MAGDTIDLNVGKLEAGVYLLWSQITWKLAAVKHYTVCTYGKGGNLKAEMCTGDLEKSVTTKAKDLVKALNRG